VKVLVEHPGGRIPMVLGGTVGIEHIPSHLDGTGAGTVQFVVDAAVLATGYVNQVRQSFGGTDVRVHVVAPGEPTAESVDAACDAVRAAATDGRAAAVVGIGGGSALDTAKQAAAVAGGGEGIEHYVLGTNPLPARGPLVAIPTTSGTGAEVTRTCVLTDRAGRKVWTWGDTLLPDLVVLDPAATVTMPPHVTTTTGLDAFVHAVEAVTGRRASALVAAPGLHAIRLVLDHLPDAVRDGTDLDARRSMQEAALLAGLAIDGGGTGIAHSIGHALGTLAHVPHGVTVAVGLAAALGWNVETSADAYAPVASVVGCATGDLANAYSALLHDVGLPSVVAGFGALSISADALADTMIAPANAPMFDNNCRRADDTERHWLAVRTLELWDELRRDS